MKQFKAEWQTNDDATIGHIITQHNALCDYLQEREGEGEKACLNCGKGINTKRKITLPKPEWWIGQAGQKERGYLEALETASKASGITYQLVD